MSIWQTIRYAFRTARLSEVRDWDPAYVAQLRDRRLRRLVRYAAARSAFYREKYRGIDLDRFQLSDLPITNKQEISAHFDDVVTDPQVRWDDIEKYMQDPANLGKYYLGRYGVSHTSGSLGAPLTIVQDKHALEILFSIITSRGSSFSKPGVMEGLRRLRSPARLAIVTWKRGFHPSGAAFDLMEDVVHAFCRMKRFSSLQPDLIDRLNEFQPHAIAGYASVLEALLIQADRLRLSPHLKQMSNTSEQLSDQLRDRLQKTFGVSIVNHYATGECLFLSEGCPTDVGAHINADWAIIEVVDEEHRPVPMGQVGKKVLITNLANMVQPFIRYEVEDMLQLTDKPCRCGSRLPRIERIEGRASELFWVGEGANRRFLNYATFQSTADNLREVREWQAILLDPRRIEMRFELLPNSRYDEESLQRAAMKMLNEVGFPAGIDLKVRIVPSLSADQTTGKFRRMINQTLGGR